MFFRELNRANCKTYMLGCERTRQALVIDPIKENTGRYLAVAAYSGLRINYVLDTHTHADHRSGIWDLAELADAKVVMDRHAPAPHVDIHLEGGSEVAIGDLRFKVLYTPGHTPDGLCLYGEGRVFTGDTLLIGGTGRSDFLGGDPGKQFDAIHQGLFALPDETLVFPAHDYRGNHSSTIAKEKATNARLVGVSREQYIEKMLHLGLPLPDKIQESLQANQSAIDDDSLKFPEVSRLGTIKEVTVAELQDRIAHGSAPLILDVREPEEYAAELGHIRGSMLIPLRALPSRAAELNAHKSDEIVVVCRAGVRSSTAASILSALGFERAGNLKGGMLEWNDAHLPVEH